MLHSTVRRSRAFLAPRPSATAGRKLHIFGRLIGVPASAAPNILQKSYTIIAEVEIPEGGAEGMIVTEGGLCGKLLIFGTNQQFATHRTSSASRRGNPRRCQRSRSPAGR